MSRIDKAAVRARATPEPPFSNATEGEGWMGAWCARNRSKTDCSCAPLVGCGCCNNRR